MVAILITKIAAIYFDLGKMEPMKIVFLMV